MGPGAAAKAAEEEEFKSTLREVLDFVHPQLGKQERKQYEDAKTRALGGTIEKSNKMPYGILQRQLQKRKEKLKELNLEQQHSGISMSANNHMPTWAVEQVLKRKKEALKEKKKRQAGGILRLGLGAHEKGGAVTISRNSLRAHKRGKK
eukprot:gnl/TRDRNA2_/TRDRNA2_87751_c0_seq1.p1 gnl/TRDRNA2_/TRDRNA2_87751_c0~~gnl/TRDRNA2_/TRDRNA2_87751_c0_seq1.p1  ORF type:complete len:167 (-),score=38.36 gnl/TRDRNA2_/TRDRNA2_87751_c0_seq1:55-501(-)